MTTPPTACYCRDCRPETLARFEAKVRAPLEKEIAELREANAALLKVIDKLEGVKS